MQKINDILEFEEPITPRHIIKAGMIYWINKLMYHGVAFEEAVFETLKRFGGLSQDAKMQDSRSINLRNNFKSFWEEIYQTQKEK